MSVTIKSNWLTLLVIVFIIAIAGVTSSCSDKAPEQQPERVLAFVKSSTGWAEMRGAPNKNSLLMMQIYNYVHVEVIGDRGEWVKVKANGRTGYMYKGLLCYH